MSILIEQKNDHTKKGSNSYYKHFKYYTILSAEIPNFLFDYINIPELKRINEIGINCGTDYTNLFHNLYFYSRLDHSIGVSLIIWNFTHDKKQTIAGLLHDIATPSFSHCIDFLHKDYMKQEATEIKTKEMIMSSKQLLYQLDRDDLSVEDIYEYKIYPIADNPSPKLSADRLEYTLSGGITFSQAWNLDEIHKIYSDLDVFINEEEQPELGFKTVEVAESFVHGASKMWYMFQSNKDKLVMQFWADIIKTLIAYHILHEDELYKLSESEIISLIQHCGINEIENAFASFQASKFIYEGNEKPDNTYTVNIYTKKRYINPLVNGIRATDISNKVRKTIYDFINYQVPQYSWFDFHLRDDIFL